MYLTVNVKMAYDESIIKTLELGTLAYQMALDIGHEKGIKNKIKLRQEMYYPFREAHPELQSTLVEESAHCAAETLSALKKKKIRTKPKVKRLFQRYSSRAFTYYKNESEISISTADGRKRYHLDMPQWFVERHPDYTVRNISLTYHKKKLTLHLMVDVPTPQKQKVNTYIGVDRGIVNIAVCSDKTFYNSKHLKNIKGKYQHVRSTLQSRGTRSAKKRLCLISGRERRFVRDVNHCVSKDIVAKADCIVLEDLASIKKKAGRKSNKIKSLRKMIGNWSRYELQRFIEYKAELSGKIVAYIDPSFTSQGCSRCNYVDKDNRHGSVFKCKSCGYELNADLNASINIVNRGILLLTGCSHTPECSDRATFGSKVRDNPISWDRNMTQELGMKD